MRVKFGRTTARLKGAAAEDGVPAGILSGNAE